MKNYFRIIVLLISFSTYANENNRLEDSFNSVKIDNACANILLERQVELESTIEIFDRVLCRICTSFSVPDGFGGMVGLEACAGNIFTSCERAGELSREKAMKKALDIMKDMN